MTVRGEDGERMLQALLLMSFLSKVFAFAHRVRCKLASNMSGEEVIWGFDSGTFLKRFCRFSLVMRPVSLFFQFLSPHQPSWLPNDSWLDRPF